LRDLGEEALDHVEPGSRGRMSAFRSCFGGGTIFLRAFASRADHLYSVRRV
jgi:hypothetical protein